MLWQLANLAPILLTNIVIDFNRQAAGEIRAVAPIPEWARNPVWVACSGLRIVFLKAADPIKQTRRGVASVSHPAANAAQLPLTAWLRRGRCNRTDRDSRSRGQCHRSR